MKFKFGKLVLVALAGSLFFASCSDDTDSDAPLGSYDKGVLVMNQGGFGHGDASLSYISEDFTTQQNNIFALVNPTITLGDTAQDIGFNGNLAFIVLNHSDKIEIVNRYTMALVASITTGLSNPRYIAFSNGKGFVTNWGDGGNTTDDYIAVLNLSTYTVSSTIPVAEGPERIIDDNGDRLYVAHAGGYGYGNTISVINSATNAFVTAITVGDVPNSLEIKNNTLFVLCGGKPSWATETAGKLAKINLSTNTVDSAIDFPAATHPANLNVISGNFYYSIDSDIFTAPTNASTLPTNELISTTPQGVYGIYSLAVKDGKIYVGDAMDYSSNGKVYVYSTAGALEHEYTVGVIPAGFYFN